jgi:hypothetical protein
MRAAASRVREHADAFGDRLTQPDPSTGEEWDRGQVLSHIAEFLPYWVEQFEGVVAAGGAGQAFGRTKQTPSRLARIESGRHRSDSDLLGEMDAGIDRAVAFIRNLRSADSTLEGTHSTRGRMTVAAAFEEFVVAHLEQHADQLEGRPAPPA